MQINRIHSSANSLLKTARALAKGATKATPELFLVEGRKLLQEAYAKNLAIVSVVASETFWQEHLTENPGGLKQIKELNVVEEQLFRQLHTTASSCGIIALVSKPEHRLEELLGNREGRPLVVAEQIQDPGNLGTMIRTALAFGASGLILSKGTVDPLSPKVVRASMGAVFALPIVVDQDLPTCLDKLKEVGIRLIALDTQGESPFWLDEAPLSAAYLFGNEGNGLTARTLRQADKIVSIPISSQTESLNVAVAMGIILCHCKNNAKI